MERENIQESLKSIYDIIIQIMKININNNKKQNETSNEIDNN